MVDKTPNLELNYIYSNQAQKEISVNEAFTTLDAVWNNGAISKAVATPPVSPALADLYIVAASPTGAWAGKAKNLAYFNNGWKFISPKEGITIWVNDENLQYTYDGINWVSTSGGLASVATDSTTIEGNGTLATPVKLKDIQPKIGINATADATNKLTVASSAVLFNHNGAGTQVKLNKNSATDTASFLYQTNFSGRAEIGLTGDDDFHFKVSPNGTSWNDAIIINKTSGDVSLNSHKITNLANPTAAQDAATKNYVDSNLVATAWGGITGTLSSQTDLNTALNNKQNLDTTLTALAAYNTNGILTQTAADTFTGRTITGTLNRISVTNGDGVSGNPTLDIGSDVVTLTGTQTLTNKSGNISQWTNNSGYITASSTNTLTNKTGNISQWTNNSGYVTASSTNTFTNKSGNISQWTNNSGYITGISWGAITGTLSNRFNHCT